MRFTITLLVFLVLSSFNLVAQSLAPTTTDTTLLWRISDNGLEKASYLFGTIHMIPADDYFLPATVESALAASDRVAFEIDTREMENPATLFGLMGKMNMRNDTTLKDLLSAEDYKSVATHFEEVGLPMMLFERMKPMFLSAMIGQDLKDLVGGFGGAKATKSYEMELTSIAKTGNKEILGLETIDFQLSLFDSIPYTVQADMLVSAIETSADPEADDQFAQMVDMYKRQAVAEMASMISEESSDDGNFEELLLTKRNISWIAPMQDLMAKGTTFFAVGAGHLGNDKGVIALLREAGYLVEPIY
jgi:uncharacterized protein YbaP (TraB family)